MNTALWIMQGLLAAFFVMPGITKLITPDQKIRERLHKAPGESLLPVRLLGLAETLGVIGILLPAYTGILPILTPITAIGFAAVMVGAIVIHAQKHEYKILPALGLALVISVTVAWFRF